ncbi:MAG TPA: hypothetical protein VFE37_27440 [Chloroflexota bacterium]|nr:hypothetical protein [Chloroflexota bacterium]
MPAPVAPLAGGAAPEAPESVTLAVRRLAHRLNNDLTVPFGALELLAAHPDLPPHLRALVHDARRGVAAATGHVIEFQQLWQPHGAR